MIFTICFSEDRQHLVVVDDATSQEILSAIIVGAVHQERADRIAKLAGDLVTECFEGAKYHIEYVGPKAS